MTRPECQPIVDRIVMRNAEIKALQEANNADALLLIECEQTGPAPATTDGELPDTEEFDAPIGNP